MATARPIDGSEHSFVEERGFRRLSTTSEPASLKINYDAYARVTVEAGVARRRSGVFEASRVAVPVAIRVVAWYDPRASPLPLPCSGPRSLRLVSRVGVLTPPIPAPLPNVADGHPPQAVVVRRVRSGRAPWWYPSSMVLVTGKWPARCCTGPSGPAHHPRVAQALGAGS